MMGGKEFLTVSRKQEIQKVIMSYDVNQANRLISEGWYLMQGGCHHTDDGGYILKPYWMLGKIKKEKPEQI